MNVVILRGNVTRDPEVREVKTGDRTTKVVNFTVAVNRFFKKSDGTRDKETTFVDCEAWDTGANTIAEYVHKGDPLLVRGSLKLDTWENADGQKRSKLRVRVNEFELLSRRENNNTTQESEPETVGASSSDPASSEDGIPF